MLSFYNTSFFEVDTMQAPLHLTIPGAKGKTVPLVDTFRLHSGSIIALAANGALQVHVYEINPPALHVGVASEEGFPLSFGSVRFIA